MIYMHAFWSWHSAGCSLQKVPRKETMFRDTSNAKESIELAYRTTNNPTDSSEGGEQ